MAAVQYCEVQWRAPSSTTSTVAKLDVFPSAPGYTWPIQHESGVLLTDSVISQIVSPGQVAVVNLPLTDQSGWTDALGAQVVGWTYGITFLVVENDMEKILNRSISPKTGQPKMNLDQDLVVRAGIVADEAAAAAAAAAAEAAQAKNDAAAAKTAADTAKAAADAAQIRADTALSGVPSRAVNGSFEDGTIGWTGLNRVEVPDAYDGKYVARYVDGTPLPQNDYNTLPVAATNQTWRGTLRARLAPGSATPTSGTLRMTTRVRLISGSYTAYSMRNISLSGLRSDWQTFSIDYTMPANVTRAALYAQIISPVPAGIIVDVDSFEWVDVTEIKSILDAAAKAQTDATNAANAAAAADQKAAAAGVLAQSADGRFTTANTNPTLSDGLNRPEGAFWEVVQADGTVIRRWVWRSGTWVLTTLAGSATIKSGSTDPARMSVGLGGNLIPDPNFRDNNQWQLTTGRSVVDTSPNSGWRSLRVPLNGAGEAEMIDFGANLMPGDRFKVSFVVRSEVGATQYRLIAYWTGVSGTLGEHVLASGFTQTSAWTYRDNLGSFEVPAEAENFFFRLEITNTSTYAGRAFLLNKPVMQRTLSGQLIDDIIPGSALPSGGRVTQGIWAGATAVELIQRTSTTKVITPADLPSLQAGTGSTGLIQLATQAELIAETDGSKAVTPIGLKMWSASKDTGWVRLTLASGWSVAAGWPAPAYRVKNGNVFLRGRLNATTAAGVTMFTLPLIATPPQQANDGSGMANGDVYVFGADAGAYARVAIYTQQNTAALIGQCFLAGKSGAVSNLSLSAIAYPND